MDRQEIERRLTAFITVDPMRAGGQYWPAHEAMTALSQSPSPDFPDQLVSNFFAKSMQVWPEVLPRLEDCSLDCLKAWAQAAKQSPNLPWNQVLLHYWKNDPARLAHGYAVLKRLFEAPADPELQPFPYQDTDLVAALMQPILKRAVKNFPTGWAALLLKAGGSSEVDLVERRIVDKVEDPRIEGELDDLRRLVVPPWTEPAAKLMLKIQDILDRRDRDNGQQEFLRELGLQPPHTFSLLAYLPAKSGHRFGLMISRDWRSSFMSWNASLGKQQHRYMCNENGICTNKLKFGHYRLSQLRQLLADGAVALKTKFTGPWVIELQEGFSTPVIPLLERYFQSSSQSDTPQKTPKEAPPAKADRQPVGPPKIKPKESSKAKP